MATLDDLLLKCIAQEGPVLNITPGKPPWIHMQSQTIELDTAPVTPEEARAMIHALLSDADKVRLDHEEHLKFDYGITDAEGQTLTFRAYVHIAKGMVFATFRDSDRFPSATPESPPDHRPKGLGGSSRDRSGWSPVFAPVGPRVPVRWGRDAKPLPIEGESDDNPAAQ